MSIDERICLWLDAHEEFFKVSVLAKAIGSNAGNFAKYRAARKFPERFSKLIAEVLGRFGFEAISLHMPVGYGKIPADELRSAAMKDTSLLPDLKSNAVTLGKVSMKDIRQAAQEATKPERLPGEDSVDYAGRVNEWKQKIK